MKVSKYMKINTIIFIALILIPSIVLASIPTATAFNRENVYELDGFRAGGYYIIRQNASYDGFMNISYSGGNNNIFNITTYNIENITLDFDLMYERHDFLFGWTNITWEDAVTTLGNDIIININSTDGLSEMRFVDQPEVIVKIWLDREVIQDWGRLEDVEIYTDDLAPGNHEVLIEFQPFQTLVDNLIFLLQFAVLIGITLLIIRWIRRALFFDEGEYYKSYGGD